jgi:hypothetical protein
MDGNSALLLALRSSFIQARVARMSGTLSSAVRKA